MPVEYLERREMMAGDSPETGLVTGSIAVPGEVDRYSFKLPNDAKMYFEALEEHRAAGELVLPDLLKTEVDSEKFSGRVKVLKELFEHHADEEEKEMFKRARALMSKKALEELGEQMAQRKVELKKQAQAA